MWKILNYTKWGKRCLLIPSILTMVLPLFLVSGCNSSLKNSAGMIIFSSDRVQIEGTEQYPGLHINYELYQMDQNGNNITRITDTVGLEQNASFSPDGKKIVFEYNPADGSNPGIYVMYANGEDAVRLSDEANHDYHPAWSPDGKSIAFSSDRDGNAEIYKMNTDGSNHISSFAHTGTVTGSYM
jgi:Tol biopolymer transport system component